MFRVAEPCHLEAGDDSEDDDSIDLGVDWSGILDKDEVVEVDIGVEGWL